MLNSKDFSASFNHLQAYLIMDSTKLITGKEPLMLIDERQNQILEIIKEKVFVRVE